MSRATPAPALTAEEERLYHMYMRQSTTGLVLPSDRKAPSVPVNKTDDIFKPQNFDEYIGQSEAKALASIMVQAAHNERRPLPNIMVVGEYGLGKTTLAQLIMRAASAPMRLYDGSSVNKELPESGTFIIDEIHNLDSSVADTLNIHLDSGKFHIIGCTNNPGKLPSAFRSRFRTLQLTPYMVGDLKTILRKVCKKKNLAFTDSALELLAKRSRFNARQAIMYLSLIFDIMSVDRLTRINSGVVHGAFTRLGVDTDGLLPRDRQYLQALPKGRAVGLQYLAAMLGIDEQTIEEEVEPFLLRMGFIDRTPRGRIRVD